MEADIAPVVLRVGMDGAVTRVPFVADERGAGALFREQIGCSLYDVIALDDRTDMFVDEEAIVGVDLDDGEALGDALNVVATMIANRFWRHQPVFGAVVIAGLSGASAAPHDADQLAQLEQLAEMSVGLIDDLGIWGDCQDFPRVDWREEVRNEATQLGYWEWVIERHAG